MTHTRPAAGVVGCGNLAKLSRQRNKSVRKVSSNILLTGFSCMNYLLEATKWHEGE